MEGIILNSIKLIKKFYTEENLELYNIYNIKDEIIIEDEVGKEIITVYSSYRIVEKRRKTIKKIEKILEKEIFDKDIQEVILKLIKEEDNVKKLLRELKKNSEEAMRMNKESLIYKCEELDLKNLIEKMENEGKIILDEIRVSIGGSNLYLGKDKEKILNQIRWINEVNFKKPIILFVKLLNRDVLRIEKKDKIIISLWKFKNKNFYKVENITKIQKYINKKKS